MSTESANNAGKGRILFLALMSALPPLSTDMYLVAIPHLAENWHVPVSTVNLSLVLWFVAFSISLLVYGALSDRFGRRPILLGGLITFSIASILCALATGPIGLIVFRIVQGMAAAAPSSMTLAYCRDRFTGKTRQRILAWIGIIVSIAPMVAPSIGAAIMHLAPWQLIFWILSLASLAQFSLAWFWFEESSTHKEHGGFLAAMKRFTRLGRNHRFVIANASMCLIAAPILGYVGIASSVYIGYYGLSESTFAILFAVLPMCSMAGAFLCTRLLTHFTDRQLILASLTGCVVGGLILVMFGAVHYLLFAAGVAVFGFFAGISRPLSNHLILEQVEQDIGAASSTIIFTQFMFGAVCMAITSGGWSQPTVALGLSIVVLPGLVLLIWPYLDRHLRFDSAPAHS